MRFQSFSILILNRLKTMSYLDYNGVRTLWSNIKSYVADNAGTADGITQSEADGRYVNVTGDTMTGDLTLNGHKVTSQEIDTTNLNALQIVVDGNTNNTAINVPSGGITAKAFYENSDLSLKDNVLPIKEKETDAIGRVLLKRFNFKGEDVTKYGVIAQDLEREGLSNLVSENADGQKTVDYISMLILCIQELRERISMLEMEKKKGDDCH